MKERAAGLFVWLLLLLPAVVAFVAVPLVVLCAPVDKAKGALRAFDELVSAALFGGSPFMSLSAWSWYCWSVDRRWWAGVVIWITDCLQNDHCAQAYLEEAPLLTQIEAWKAGRN